jgi:DNA-binding NarL/FixJ family response regulator
MMASPLTERETTILQLIAQGYSNKMVAHELHIAYQTVRNYMPPIIEKCKAKNRTHAVVMALKHGWIKF